MSGGIQYLVVLAILGGAVVFVTEPLRKGVAGRQPPHDSEVAELEAAREAKYRELRDAELDHRTGKLSDADYEALDRSLRGEAIEILRGLDHEHARVPEDD